MKWVIKISVGLAVLAVLGTGVVSVAPEAVRSDQSGSSIGKSRVAKSVEDKLSVQERIISLGKNDNRVMHHLYYLTDRIGPRPAGSENFEMACKWARDRFSEFGLRNAHLERCAEVPVKGFVASFVGLIKAPTPVFNVVADIPGTELPDEYVIVGAHIDSDDAGTGAADNGTGVAAAMEAARILMESGARPRRTIRFTLFGGEELGKVGSQAYVADHPELMPRVSAMLNMDQGGDHISGIYATDDMMEDFRQVFAPVKSLQPEMPFAVQRVEQLTQIIADCCGGAGTSDHGPFFEAGVPAFNWLQKGKNPALYRPHTKYDTYEYVNPEYQKHSATVIALAAFGIADLDHMLSRENLGTAPVSPAKGSRCCPSASGSCGPSWRTAKGSSCCPSASNPCELSTCATLGSGSPGCCGFSSEMKVH